MKNNALSRKMKRTIVLAVILVVALALTLLAVQIVKQLKSQGESESEGNADQSITGQPAEIPVFELGEICEETSVDGSYHSIVFNNVYLTDEINGNKGQYVVFAGNINTTDFSFDTGREFGLDLSYIGKTEVHKYFDDRFEAELSEALSEIDLLIDGENGAMQGAFCLVFSIDDTSYDLIKEGLNKTKPTDIRFGQMHLGISANWCNHATFRFYVVDVQSIESIN